MKSKAIRKWAAGNCPYKKFKWHTEEMCKNCTKDAEQIEKLIEEDKQDLTAQFMAEIAEAKSQAEDISLIGRLFGRKAAVLSALEELKTKAKQIGE